MLQVLQRELLVQQTGSGRKGQEAFGIKFKLEGRKGVALAEGLRNVIRVDLRTQIHRTAVHPGLAYRIDDGRFPDPFGPANTRKRSDRAMAVQAAGSLIRFTRLVTLPDLSTFTSQPSFTTSSSST